uniref:Potassium channel toxin alpha-KTx 29.1 n=1 Tax=Lychas mucronatus TaxID=172552 RepID=KA291_LYCMC|nr:RecName: Full=Potassium channel toxin alpha-KTx 29.1; AltName: Full=Neurotoxin-F; AltName: Full=Toxin LmKTx2; Flags: Precursor [Lychas mucronatus]ABY26657.1 neurotoxin KTx2 [Lychas mucronatus]
MKSVCGVLIILVVLTTMLSISTFSTVGAEGDCPISEAIKCVEKCKEKVEVCEPGVCKCSG